MNFKLFRILIILVAIIFTAIFCIVVIPPLFNNPDVFAALAAGFVNPYASGYSSDVIACWFILCFWIIYEATSLGVKHGWLCILLGLFPGVAVGFAIYLLMRNQQLNKSEAE